MADRAPEFLERSDCIEWRWPITEVPAGAEPTRLRRCLRAAAEAVLEPAAPKRIRSAGRARRIGADPARDWREHWRLRRGLFLGCDLTLRMNDSGLELTAEPASRSGAWISMGWTALVVVLALAAVYALTADQLPAGRAALPALALIALLVAPVGGICAALLAAPIEHLLNRRLWPRRFERCMDIARGSGAVAARGVEDELRRIDDLLHSEPGNG